MIVLFKPDTPVLVYFIHHKDEFELRTQNIEVICIHQIHRVLAIRVPILRGLTCIISFESERFFLQLWQPFTTSPGLPATWIGCARPSSRGGLLRFGLGCTRCTLRRRISLPRPESHQGPLVEGVVSATRAAGAVAPDPTSRRMYGNIYSMSRSPCRVGQRSLPANRDTLSETLSGSRSPSFLGVLY